MPTATAEVQTLLGAVRRALWRAQLRAAVRLALWGSAGLMLLAAAVHLAFRAVPPGAVLWALGVQWASMMVWAATRRPADATCALWADRHLGGASAFTTWLEMGPHPPGIANAAVLRWLDAWTAARVPDSLRRLAGRPPSAHLARPLLCMLVCAALTTLVLTMPSFAPRAPRSPAQAGAAPAFGTADAVLPGADVPQAGQIVSEIASALRAAQLSDAPAPAPARGRAGQAPAAGPGQADDGQVPVRANAGASVAAAPGARAGASGPSAGPPDDGSAAAGTAQSPGAGAARQAGQSRDERAGAGVSKWLRGTMAVQRPQARDRRLSPEKQADMDRLGSYDDDPALPGSGAMRTDAAPAAATPPPVTAALRLSPAESTYVQAWLKASARNR